MIDDPEEEAWLELEKKLRLQEQRLIADRAKKVRGIEDAFTDYLNNMGAPRTVSDVEVRRHFTAGWVAGILNEWAKERND